MSFGTLALASIAFIELFLFLDLGRKARVIVQGAHEALRGLRQRELDDARKEAIARAAARQIFGATCQFLARFALIVGIIGGAILGVAALSPAVGRELAAEAASPATLAALTAIAICYGCMRGTILR